MTIDMYYVFIYLVCIPLYIYIYIYYIHMGFLMIMAVDSAISRGFSHDFPLSMPISFGGFPGDDTLRHVACG